MITQEHLEHWVREIEYQLKGAINEVSKENIIEIQGTALKGIYISFEYLREKLETSKRLLQNIRWDMEHDGV